jgi:hypothetical protein
MKTFKIIHEVIDYLKTQNPIFADSGYFYDPDAEPMAGISDNHKNAFYAQIVTAANAQDFTFTPANISGCGSYNITAQVDWVFWLEKCFDRYKVLQALTDQLSIFEDITIQSAGINPENIYRDIHGTQLSSKMNIIRFRTQVRGMYTRQRCIEICDENCCC